MSDGHLRRAPDLYLRPGLLHGHARITRSALTIKMNNGEDSTFILEFAPNAIHNLDEIEAYIAKTAYTEIADKVIDRILDRCEQLTRMPRIGRSRNDIAAGVRSMTSGNYVIYYRINGNRIEILRIWHGFRDQQKLENDLS
ncbi:MAG: type II toxin-antitoxin system RelE/ParE family toxin [Candidatus Melainabacteria bacterium]|nr:type II toxin-antitoxin system RelE/ParE family toxin [Candidatus Melainabacteria bacterium]